MNAIRCVGAILAGLLLVGMPQTLLACGGYASTYSSYYAPTYSYYPQSYYHQNYAQYETPYVATYVPIAIAVPTYTVTQLQAPQQAAPAVTTTNSTSQTTQTVTQSQSQSTAAAAAASQGTVSGAVQQAAATTSPCAETMQQVQELRTQLTAMRQALDECRRALPQQPQDTRPSYRDEDDYAPRTPQHEGHSHRSYQDDSQRLQPPQSPRTNPPKQMPPSTSMAPVPQQSDALALLSQRCASCHDEKTAEEKGKGAVLFRGGKFAPGSLLAKALARIQGNSMPPKSSGVPQLTDEEFSQVAKWVENDP